MKYFITGTDTDIGKTYVASSILNSYKNKGFTTLGIKPVASGSIANGKNADAVALQNASTLQLPYEHINPFLFEEHVSPHIAAKIAGVHLSVDKLIRKTSTAFNHEVDMCLIEGAGGWFTPINENETLADFAKALNLPVIIVVGLRLGCINHALLTYHAIKKMELSIAGWVGNCIDPDYLFLDENIETLKLRMSAPCFGVVGWGGELTHHPL